MKLICRCSSMRARAPQLTLMSARQVTTASTLRAWWLPHLPTSCCPRCACSDAPLVSPPLCPPYRRSSQQFPAVKHAGRQHRDGQRQAVSQCQAVSQRRANPRRPASAHRACRLAGRTIWPLGSRPARASPTPRGGWRGRAQRATPRTADLLRPNNQRPHSGSRSALCAVPVLGEVATRYRGALERCVSIRPPSACQARQTCTFQRT